MHICTDNHCSLFRAHSCASNRVCKHTQTHTYTHSLTYTHTCKNTHTHTNANTLSHTHTRTRKHTHIQIAMLTLLNTPPTHTVPVVEGASFAWAKWPSSSIKWRRFCKILCTHSVPPKGNVASTTSLFIISMACYRGGGGGRGRKMENTGQKYSHVCKQTKSATTQTIICTTHANITFTRHTCIRMYKHVHVNTCHAPQN